MIKVEIIMALKGSRMYPKGEIVTAESKSKLPSEIRGEIEIGTGTCRVIYEGPDPAVSVPTLPPEPPEPSFRAKHKGSGRYIVINNATGEEVSEGLMSKEEAFDLADHLNEAPSGESGEHLREIYATSNSEEAEESSEEDKPALRTIEE